MHSCGPDSATSALQVQVRIIGLPSTVLTLILSDTIRQDRMPQVLELRTINRSSGGPESPGLVELLSYLV